jgi:ribosomal protein S18 acetylase RimI-like enzyme
MFPASAEPAIGPRIVVRQARCQDGASVGRFLVGLPLISRYQRFFSGIRWVSPELARELSTSTPNRLILLALDGSTVVGHIMAVCADESAVDIGIVVAEAYQYRGIGRRLVYELAAALGAGGRLTQVRCDVLSENHFVLEWLRRLIPDLRLDPDGETITVSGRVSRGWDSPRG